MPTWLEVPAAVALLGVLGYALASPLWQRRRRPAGGQEEAMRLRIGGMTCSHCAAAVRRALLESPGVQSAEVDLGAGLAVVHGGEADAKSACAAVEALGYSARPEPENPAG